ncbi:hypothetical protein AB5I41_29795 [Sphingomonas sp. MMS24-JH45]
MIRYLAPLALLLSPSAEAQELFAGVFAHGVDTPLTFDTGEGGTDIQAGVRGDPIPDAGVASLAPMRWCRSTRAATPASRRRDCAPDRARRLASPSRAGRRRPRRSLVPRRRGDQHAHRPRRPKILFAPEIGVGVNVLPLVTVEATWTHISHAQIFGPQNPGLDMIGTRGVARPSLTGHPHEGSPASRRHAAGLARLRATGGASRATFRRP